MIECSWKTEFGFDCLTCGFQRSLSLLFQGEVWASLCMYPATIPLLLTFIFSLLHILLKIKNGAKVIVYLFSGSTMIMLVSFMSKLIIN